MSPEDIRQLLNTRYPQLRATERSPDGWSFWLDEGGRSIRVFYANRSSAHALTKVRLAISMRLRRPEYNVPWLQPVPDKRPHYYHFTGGQENLVQLVDQELQLHQEL